MADSGSLNLTAGLALHGARFLQPGLLMGIVSLATSLFHARFDSWWSRRGELRLDGRGLTFRLAPMRRFEVSLAEIAGTVGRGA